VTVQQSPDCQPPQGGSRSFASSACTRPSTLGTWLSFFHVVLPFSLPIALSAPEEQSVLSFLTAARYWNCIIHVFNCLDAMDRNVNKHCRICGPHISNKFIFFCNFYGSRFYCFNMVKMSNVNNSDLKDTDIASL